MNLIFLISIEVLEKDFIFLYNNSGDSMDNKNEYKMSIRNFFGHLNTVNKHRFKVFCLCCRVGIPVQGLLHDLSKYMPVEFLEGVKYYQGTYSPIMNCKRKVGYSLAWIHHINCNKHHYEYWIDLTSDRSKGLQGMKMPVRYVVEMFIDRVAASKVYAKDAYTDSHALEYYKKTRKYMTIHPDSRKLLEHLLVMLSRYGEDRTMAYIRNVVLKGKYNY